LLVTGTAMVTLLITLVTPLMSVINFLLLVFLSIGMLLGYQFIDPVSLAFVMVMQFGLIIPG
jgi:hypothetical protein